MALEVGGSGKWKGKGRPQAGGKGSVLNETPKGAGLRDGQAVAFRFGSGEKEGGGGGDEEDDEMDSESEGEWDVVVPSFEYDEEG